MSNEINEEWPDRINVMKIVSYDIETIFEQIKESNKQMKEDDESFDENVEITLQDVIDRIYTYALDEMSCGWGHQADLRDLIFQDENGEEY